MPVLKYHNFVGRIPILHKTKLPPSAAQVCDNAVVESGALAPMKTLGDGSSLATAVGRRTAYYIPTHGWKSWAGIADVVPAPVENTEQRFFFAGVSEGYPKVCSKTLEIAGETRRLGVLQPNYANNGAPLGHLAVGTGDGTVTDVVTYAYTCVDEFGGESVLSDPTSPPVDLEGGQCIRLTGFVRNSLVTYGNDIKSFRLYRRVRTTSGEGDWFWVKARVGSESATAVWELPAEGAGAVGEATHVFDSDGTGTAIGDIGDNCESQDYHAPPATAIGMTEIQNGVILVWGAKQVCPNVPFHYSAFPEKYRFDFAETIMGIGVYNETALVATNGQPYLIGGVSPANYIKKRLPFPWPCLSRGSVVSSNLGVFYASERGMVWWSGSDIKIVTRRLISEAQWTALVPANMLAFFYKGQIYVFSYGAATGFILDVSGEQPFIVNFTLPYNVYGGFVDAGSDDLRLICLSGGLYKVHNFGDGANLTLKWTSREAVTPAMNFSAIKILGSGWGICGVATVKVYADGTLRDTVVADGDTVARLSSGYRGERWHIEVEMTCGVMEAVALGTSMEELDYV